MLEKGETTHDASKVGRSDFADGHVRDAQGLVISSIGLGMRPGAIDETTDDRYRNAIVEAASRGCNLFDTSIDYREGRSERVLGRALEELESSDDLFAAPVVCTKGGTIGTSSVLGSMLDSAPEGAVVEQRYTLRPELLEAQVNLSLDRLKRERVDIYYLDGLEAHARARGTQGLASALARALETLEQIRARGRIRFFGLSSRTGMLKEPGDPDYLGLESLVEVARKVGGKNSGLRFVQCPYSITNPEAMTGRNQLVEDSSCSLIQAAGALELTFIAAESLASGRTLSEEHPWLPGVLARASTRAQRAIQFVRSTPGVSAALVGTSRPEHAAENLELAHIPYLPRERFSDVVPPEAPQVPWLY